MAGSTVIVATTTVVLVLEVPTIIDGVNDGVQTMRSTQSQRQTGVSRLVADIALDNGTAVALELVRRDVVIGERVDVGPLGMCAAMAGLTEQARVPGLLGPGRTKIGDHLAAAADPVELGITDGAWITR